MTEPTKINHELAALAILDSHRAAGYSDPNAAIVHALLEIADAIWSTS